MSLTMPSDPPPGARPLTAPEDLEAQRLFEQILKVYLDSGHQFAICLVLVPITGGPDHDVQCQSNMPSNQDMVQALKLFIARVEPELRGKLN